MNDRFLVTGGSGFLGKYMVSRLHKGKAEVHCIIRRQQGRESGADQFISHISDILDKVKVSTILKEVQPTHVVHLAGQSSTRVSWEDPSATMVTNVLGTLSLLEAVRQSGMNPRILVVCSAAEYGFRSGLTSIRENSRLAPFSPYGVSKVAQDMIASVYARHYSLNVIRARPFSIAGPGGQHDRISEIVRIAAEIRLGLRTRKVVSDLREIRDITDARDVVTALELVSRKGKAGEAYNICSGKGHSLLKVWKILLGYRKKENNLMRLVEDTGHSRLTQVGDNSKLLSMGWRQRFMIRDTLIEMLRHTEESLGAAR